MKTEKTFALVVFIALAAVALAGCIGPTNPPAVLGPAPSLPVELPLRRYVVGRSLTARPIGALLAGQGADVTFILATIHGDEPAGTILVHQLIAHLQRQPQLLQDRSVVLLPIANPDGMAAGIRFNAGGVDLNRNFISANRIDSPEHGTRALSEPEARTIEQIIRLYAPDRIVSIHQVRDTGPGGLASRFPAGCIDYDGPAKPLAERMAQHCDLTVEKLGAAPGSLGSYAGLTLKIPLVTLELPRTAHLLDSKVLWRRYGPALLAAIAFPQPPQ